MHAIRVPCSVAVLFAYLSCAAYAAAADPSLAGAAGAGGFVQSGDKAAYATWNANGQRSVHGVELRDAATGRLLASASRKHPWTAGSMGWRGYGAAYLRSDGIRIPERVGISWWFDEGAAKRRDPASRQGPYVIDLRGRLGERALAAAAGGDRRFMLEIGIGAGVVPPVLRWHLRDRNASPPGGVVERGGDEVDWRPTSWR